MNDTMLHAAKTPPKGSMVASTVAGPEDGGTARLAVIAKRRYRIAAGRCVDGTDAPLLLDSRYADSDEDSILLEDSDLVAPDKTTTDVILRGSAYSHRGRTRELLTTLTVNTNRVSITKSVLVTGERRLRVHGQGRLSMSDPEPFQRMDLGWHRAFGGRDRGSEAIASRGRPSSAPGAMPSEDDVLAACAHSYPRNRHGRGFWIDCERRRLDGERLPNQCDPEDPVTADRLLSPDPLTWMDAPTAAGFGPVDIFTFPRLVLGGVEMGCTPPTQPLRESALGALGPGPTVFNCAAPGLGNVQLVGNERVELQNLHRSAERFVFALPGERPRMRIEPPNTRTYELEAQLATVLIEPDRDCVTLTWAGAMPVAAEYPAALCAQIRHHVFWNGESS